MTIFILDNDPQKIAEYLDDRSLDSMIKDIAQVLTGCHQAIPEYWVFKNTINHLKWIKWARECKANYLYLVDLGISCTEERYHRLGKFVTKREHDVEYESCVEYKELKAEAVIDWANENVPNLPDTMQSAGGFYMDDETAGVFIQLPPITGVTLFPLVIPKKYQPYQLNCEDHPKEFEIIVSCRNYYQAKLKPKPCRKHDCCLYANKGYCLTNEVKWTNRSKPDWVQL